MARINENYFNLQGNYLFAEIGKRVERFKAAHPDADVIKLGIGDVTRPLTPAVIASMHTAVDEMGEASSFRGYGPEQGYPFLREKIADVKYTRRGAAVDKDEIFISDGSKCDTGNILEIFGTDNKIAITDPVYPVYVDTNVMSGRSGPYKDGKYENITYIPCTIENNFVPELPKDKVDIIYLCYPNNPTGMVLNKSQLKKWVDYARENKAIILFDAAYEAYVREDDIPHTIYEIPGADEVAIEFNSFSKSAAFTGTRCAYTLIPKKVMAYSSSGEAHPLHPLWNRRHTTKFNGVSYIVQRAAEAALSEEGLKQTGEIIDYYMANAEIIKEGLKSVGIQAFGGVNSPYIWLKTPNGMTSWQFFDKLLNDVSIAGTPGAGFGRSGEGYFRLTAFGSRENTYTAVDRIKNKLKLK
ncbi:MAG: LL-diaminopimelate aminotransferase [Eubacteriales bacterium]|nr:LL-diaminopimelate aminotransferase [Eubacteriales bacterium]